MIAGPAFLGQSLSMAATQSIALNATAPTINLASGGLVQITGATTSTTVNLPASPSTGQECVIVNKATAAWTLSGNGKNIDGAATVQIPGRFWPLHLFFDGTQWNTIAGGGFYEGVWTPELVFSSPSSGVVYTRQNGFYTVMGNTCQLWFDISYSTKPGGTGSLLLSGIPAALTPASGQRTCGIVTAASDAFPTCIGLDFGIISSVFTFMKATSQIPVPHTDLAFLGGSTSGYVAYKL